MRAQIIGAENLLQHRQQGLRTRHQEGSVCVCVCVCERERGREKEREREYFFKKRKLNFETSLHNVRKTHLHLPIRCNNYNPDVGR